MDSHVPWLHPLQPTPLREMQGDFRKVSLSSEIKKTVTKDPEESLSWVWQEVGDKTAELDISGRKPRISSEDSGVVECEAREPEEFFGPVDITDEIFDDMFSPSNSKPSAFNPVGLGSTYENIFHFSEAEEDLKLSGKITEL